LRLYFVQNKYILQISNSRLPTVPTAPPGGRAPQFGNLCSTPWSYHSLLTYEAYTVSNGKVIMSGEHHEIHEFQKIAMVTSQNNNISLYFAQ
jgi:hypothetical protein